MFAFLDDIYVVCPSPRVAPIFKTLTAALWTYAHFQVHLGKTQFWNRSGVFPERCEGIVETARLADPTSIVWKGDPSLPIKQQGVKVLGTPVGHSEYVRQKLRDIGESHNVLFERIQAIPDLQCAWLVLLFCAATRANFLLRRVHPNLVVDFARHHDNSVWACLSSILNTDGDFRA